MVSQKKKCRGEGQDKILVVSVSLAFSHGHVQKKNQARTLAGRGTGTNDGGEISGGGHNMAKIKTYLKKMIIINPQYPPQREMVVGADGRRLLGGEGCVW